MTGVIRIVRGVVDGRLRLPGQLAYQLPVATTALWFFLAFSAFPPLGLAEPPAPQQTKQETAGQQPDDPLAAGEAQEKPTGEQEPRDLFDLSLEELGELAVACTATLTMTDPRRVPAAVTTIDQEMIRHSGARNLNELLDIFVPNVEIMRQHSREDRVGVRGIINVPSHKYLLLVNGRVMNLRLNNGAITERDLPMFADVHHVDVVRGPGSVVYGPGAISAVINIVTYNGLNFEGTEVIARHGFIERFSSLEIRHGHRFDEESGLFLYYGITDYDGADQDDAPYIFSKSFTTNTGVSVSAGVPPDFDIANDRAAFRSHPKHKLHLQYTRGSFDAWIRYTRGGRQTAEPLTILVPPPLGVGIPGQQEARGEGTGYQQLTLLVSYTQEVSDELSLDMRIGYDFADIENLYRPDSRLGHHLFQSSREAELYMRFLGRWTPSESHAVAAGVEYSHEWFGRDATGFSTTPTSTSLQPEVSPWSTNTYSPLAEYQWRMNNQWTLFLGARADKHTYTDWLFSPRAVLIYTPNDQDTIKLIANQSVRRPGDDGLRFTHQQTGRFADEEIMRSLELRYERQHNEHLWLAASAFYLDSDVVAVEQALRRNARIGQFDSFGFEAEVSYRTDKVHLAFSHGFTKLNDFELDDPATVQGFSARPYGVGNDFANWSNHTTKLYGRYDFHPNWSVDGSLRVYWGFPGGEDLTKANNDFLRRTGRPRPFHPLSDPGQDEAFDASAFMNLGLEHYPTDKLTIRLDAYNVLGWIDKDVNKRNYHVRSSEYRSEAAAVGVTLRYSF